MKRPTDKPSLDVRRLHTAPVTPHDPTHEPAHDYGPALQSAVNWLGARYLLAEPVRKLPDDRKPYYVETRRWHPATRH